ncbi:MAG: hypothetical protein ACI9R3_000454 [Verrucomicrobiales bacterium]|jgi:hypothetical protein
MAGKSSRRGTGAGASGAGFRRTGTQPGAARRGAFIVYTDTPDNMVDTMFRLRWKLALVFTIFVLIGVAIFMMQMGTEESSNAQLVVPEEVNETKAVAKFEPPALAVDFLRANTLPKKLALIRDPNAMADHIIQYYNGSPNRPERYSSITPITDTYPTQGVKKFYVTSDGDQRILAIVDTSEGPKVDWPTYSRMSDVDWETFRKGDDSRPKKFRVQITELDYYAGEFADPKLYKCFQISSPELYRDLFGYAERGSETEKNLSNFSALVKRRCVLELAPPASPDARQLHITGLVTQDWVVMP